MNNFKEAMMAKIDAGAIAMKSRRVFFLQRSAVVLLALLALVVSAHLFAFLLFSIRASGVSELLGFGTRGVPFFLTFFPWHLLALDVFLILLIAHLARRWEWGWKTPRLYLALFLLLAVFLAGAITARVPSFARLHASPPPPPLGSGFTQGVVLSQEGDFVTIIDERTGDITEIVLPEGFTYSSDIGEGKRVIVVGDEKEGFIDAFGIRSSRWDSIDAGAGE
jgi:hypothetical protein